MQGRGKDAAEPHEASAGGAGLTDTDTDGTAAAAVSAAVFQSQTTGAQADGSSSAGSADHVDRESEPEVRLDEAAQALIGQHLKAVYSEIVQQPVPDEFLKLLEELERKEKS